MAEGGDRPGPGDDDAGPVYHSLTRVFSQRRQAAAHTGPLPHSSTSTFIPSCSRPATAPSCSAVSGAAASKAPYRDGSSKRRFDASPACLDQSCITSGDDWSPTTRSISSSRRPTFIKHPLTASPTPSTRVRLSAFPCRTGRAAPPLTVASTLAPPLAARRTAAAAARAVPFLP